MNDLDIEPEAIEVPDGIEPEPIVVEPVSADDRRAMAAASLQPMTLAEVLPADFPLPTLIRWVPDLAVKARLDEAIAHAATVDIASECGMDHADAAMAAIRACVKAAESNFEEPKRLANEIHKSITGRLAEWIAPAKTALDKVGRAVAAEHRRRDEAAAKVRREAQEKANAEARKRAEEAAAAAKKQGAPAAVVEQMVQQAAVVTAPPVPLAPTAPAPLAHSTVTKTWKARIAGTPADADPNPTMAGLTPAQQQQVLAIAQAVGRGELPLTMFDSLNWSLLNARAKAEKGTLAIPGIEAYEDLSTRAKAGRRA